MRRVKDFLRRYWSLWVLVVVWGWVAWKSFEPGTWLLGWDNLVPEWNFGLEFKRLLWGVWQEYRGVGVLGGMAHVADLPRVVILWVLHWVVPRMYLRWLWHLGMLLLGPVGVWLTLYLVAGSMYHGDEGCKIDESQNRLRNTHLLPNEVTNLILGLVGGLFYLLNPATLQYFYTPYESFSSFYGFFPWLMGLAIVYLRTGKRKFLKWFLVMSVLGTSAFYVQTLFVVYGMVLGVWLMVFGLELIWFQNRLRNLVLWSKQVTNLILVVLVANAFWLLPVGYFTWTNSQVTVTNHINSIATPETALMNQAFGNWRDVLGLRGYWLEYGDWKGEKYTRLMDGGWYEWLMKPEVKKVATGVGMLVVLYFMFCVLCYVWKRKVERDWWLVVGGLGTVLVAWVMLGSYNPPFGFVYEWLVEHVPLFGEIFRSVFTKWSMVMAWGMSLGIAYSVFSIQYFFRRKRFLVWGVVAGMVVLIVYVMWPAFGQGMIYKRMKVRVPEEYFEMFGFFKREPMGRVAYFPVQTFWGWDFLKWGYRGSGFLWYGMEQPVLHRSFDVWSPYNEGFYDQISEAVYNCELKTTTQKLDNVIKGPTRLSPAVGGMQTAEGSDPACTAWVGRVLQKYDVRYVLLDRSVMEPGKKEEVLRIPEIEQVMDELGERVFEKGFLTVWKITSDQRPATRDQ